MQTFEERLKKFQGKKVLHIGNIANNAYINAKIMRAHGIKADVLCADYYHIMACPEWDEAEIEESSTIDACHPCWKKVDLKGFQRPKWFYQGTRSFALKALIYKHGNKKIREKIYRLLMNLSCKRYLTLFKLYHNNRDRLDYTRKRIILLRQFIYKMRVFCGLKSHKNLTHQIKSHKNSIFERLIQHYDIVQCYATDGIHMLDAGRTDFAAYEHGTIRDIPFEDNEQGKQCRDVYTKASVVFITNTDCMAAAEKLKIPMDRLFPIPHAFDNDKAFRFKKKWKSQLNMFDIPTFLAPSRHHWKEGFSSWLKGNDKIIKAASLLKKEGLPFKIIFIEWGQEVDLSKNLINELGVGDVIEWWKPLTKFQLWQTYLKVDGVIDQFILPAMGGVGFETLAMGTPLFSNIDEDVLASFFGKSPPIFNVKNEHDLYAALRRLLLDRSLYKHVEKEGQKWIQDYHSSERILDIHLTAYEKIINERQKNASLKT